MTKLESRVMGYICCVLGFAFAYLDAPWLSLGFCLAGFCFLVWVVYKDCLEYFGGRRTRTAETSLTDAEIITKQQKEIEKLQRKIARLEKRFLAKKKYELEDLFQRGATTTFMDHIDQKDRAALRSE